MAKADKFGHPELTTAQYAAVDLLATGRTDKEVAEAVGKSRQCINGWRAHHPLFRAELNRRRHEIWATSGDKLRALLPRAVEVLEQELMTAGGEHRLKIALEVVRMAGVSLADIGPQTASEFVAQEVKNREAAVMLSLGAPSFAEVEQDLLARADEG